MARSFNPASWADGVTIPHVADYQAIAADLYTRGDNVDGGGHGRPNTGFVGLVPGALPGTTYTVTGASWVGGVATLVIAGHTVGVNQLFTSSGISPIGYNAVGARVSAVTPTTISFALAANPGAYVSGGTVLVGSVPAFGTLAVDSLNHLQIYTGSTWAAATTAVAAGAWLAGSGVPGVGVGSNGDMYVNIAAGAGNGDVYGPKSGGAWGSSPLNIKGPTGATGATGATGPTGATGTAATIAVGTTTTGAAGSSATVNNSGSSSAAVFNFSVPQGAAGTNASAANWRGAYNAGTTYAQGDGVTDSGVAYVSVVSANTGHTPASSPTQWQNVGTAGMAAVSGTGLVKVTAGASGLATVNTDYMGAVSGSGVVKVASGVPALATANTDYMAALSGSGLVKIASGVPGLATAGTDYQVVPGAWQSITLLNSWTASASAPECRLEGADVVRFRGEIFPGTTASGTQIFTMPAPLRPVKNRYVLAVGYSASGPLLMQVYVLTTGEVYFYTAGATVTQIWLDGVVYSI